jgi:fused signal recognition particle receptor
MGGSLRRLWSGGVSENSWAGLEEQLLAGDVGVEATGRIVARARSARPVGAAGAVEALRHAILQEFGEGERTLSTGGGPAVILVVGVNGSGKTTTIAKVARMLSAAGQTVLLAAADTFRAAAVTQLQVWADRVGVDMVRGQEGGDPASVAFDAVQAARSRSIDVVIVDTAGRLHSRRDLMDQLSKVYRVVSGTAPVTEVLLVLDASSGQNGLSQVKEFLGVVPVTGIVLTKLDGTAKGGIVVAAESQTGIPIKLVGTGEGLDDLAQFDPDSFVDALLEEA